MTAATPSTRLFHFIAGHTGPWIVERSICICGDPLPWTPRVAVVAEAAHGLPDRRAWSLRGITSNERYVTRSEKIALLAKQEGLGRAQATHAALIPIRKNAAWWAMTQDERRHILEEQSQHIAIGLKYLPAIARRLHHCRDLGSDQPFDFITWFEFAPADTGAFNELLAALRATPEWQYVDREVDIRLKLTAG
jgi:hypothetical protein